VVHQRNKEEKITKFIESMKIKHNLPELLGYSKGNVKRKVYSYRYIFKKSELSYK
jgi:hypothetical protein